MTATLSFTDLNLPAPILSVLTELGYEAPTSVQAQSIPILLEGNDLLAQAQTGTGKTAAFALPVLSQLDMALKAPQSLVIAPTRELAIQVAEAFQTYAKHIKGFHVAPIYGGQAYPIQLKALKRGPQVIVGTPGRIMDHLRRGSLTVKHIKHVVLDEADEMLNMGFLQDIQWIFEQIPNEHQTALFSATMPGSIKQIAKRYLNNPLKVHIKPTGDSASKIEQFFTRVSKNQKLDVLTRFLEVEDINAAIIFARTKNCSMELTERLQARGYAAAALNGDLSQNLREKVINKLKRGNLDIIVATDVAARGIDVEHVTHVINYDIPQDAESYIHRIGRTGRAGRKGKALLFVSPREFHLLNDIERSTKKTIEEIMPPSLEEISERRHQKLTEKIAGILDKSKQLAPFRETVKNIIAQTDYSAEDVASALLYLIQQSKPMPKHESKPAGKPEFSRDRGGDRSRDRKRHSNSSDKSRSFKNSKSSSSKAANSSKKPKFAKSGKKPFKKKNQLKSASARKRAERHQ